jgi:hypothetical protein
MAQPPNDLAKVQEDERDVLKAIFMDDYEEIEAKSAWSVCLLLPLICVAFLFF